MANHLAIQSFCQSLVDYLSQRHATFVPSVGVPALPSTGFQVISASKFSSTEAIDNKMLTLYLHRVSINNQLRNVRTGGIQGPLALDLHFILIVTADKPEDEHAIFGWVMRELHLHSYMDASTLSDSARWAVDERIDIVPAELTPDETANIWEAANRGYLMSYPFIARTVRIGATTTPDGAPTVASRFTFTDNLKETVP